VGGVREVEEGLGERLVVDRVLHGGLDEVHDGRRVGHGRRHAHHHLARQGLQHERMHGCRRFESALVPVNLSIDYGSSWWVTIRHGGISLLCPPARPPARPPADTYGSRGTDLRRDVSRGCVERADDRRDGGELARAERRRREVRALDRDRRAAWVPTVLTGYSSLGFRWKSRANVKRI
jgi:hypothetical protein